MKIVRGIGAADSGCRGSHAAIGNFDGVHRGHQAVIQCAIDSARAAGEAASVVTFEPHPRSFFGRADDAFRLTPPATKERRLAALGLDVLFVFPFDAELASMSAEHFAGAVLGDGLGLRSVSVGGDFRFGHRRAGGIELLRACGRARGYAVHRVDLQTEGGAAFASSAIRDALRVGDVREAARQLGDWFRIEGTIERGAGRGAGLGMATANLSLEGMCLPAFGVYAVEAVLRGGPHDGIYSGVAGLGVNPTFGGTVPGLEVHLFGFAGEELYGYRMSVGLCAYQRPEEKFTSPDALARRMQQDAVEARQVLGALEPPWQGGAA